MFDIGLLSPLAQWRPYNTVATADVHNTQQYLVLMSKLKNSSVDKVENEK